MIAKNIKINFDFVLNYEISHERVWIECGFVGRSVYLMIFKLIFGSFQSPHFPPPYPMFPRRPADKVLAFTLPYMGRTGQVHKFLLHYRKDGA